MQMNHSRFGLPTGRFLTALALGLTVASVHAQTQTAKLAAPDETSALEEVVFTVTAIKGLNAETSLPVQVIKAEDIARTGVTTTEDLFRMITAASAAGSVQTAQSTGNVNGSLSAISLRGPGSGRTLVLINGRRAAVYGGGSNPRRRRYHREFLYPWRIRRFENRPLQRDVECLLRP